MRWSAGWNCLNSKHCHCGNYALASVLPPLDWAFPICLASAMSQKLYLSIKPKSYSAGGLVKNAELGGDYVVSLRADTPESCLASAAFDTVLRYFSIDNGEDFNVTTRDAGGQIVLDTALPAIGAMAGYGLSAQRLESGL